MAAYGYSVAITSRSKGKGAVGGSAYIRGEDLYDERTGKLYRGSQEHREQDILAKGVIAPDFAPSWMLDADKLWNAVEAAEDEFNIHKDRAQTARRVIVSLPHELTEPQRLELARDFIQQAYVDRGMVADFALHAPNPEGDQRNFHAHIHLTMRSVDANGFTPEKNRDWNSREQLAEWRALYADVGADHLANAGFELEAGRFRVAHLRTYDHAEPGNPQTQYAKAMERGDVEWAAYLEGRIPEPKIGPVATAIEREGRESHAGNDWRDIRAQNDNRVRNAELAKLRAESAGNVGNVADLADTRREDVDKDKLRRARNESTRRVGVLVESEEVRRAKLEADKEQASAQYDKLVREQLDNIKKMEGAQSEISPEERMRREHQAAFEKESRQAEMREDQIKRAREAEEANGDIRSASLRHAEAMGQAHGNTFYAKASDAAAKEGAMAAREHQKLLDEAFKAETPEQGKIITMQAHIQFWEYHAKAHQTMAGQSDYIAGNKASVNGDVHRNDAEKATVEATRLRKERGELIVQHREIEKERAAEAFEKARQAVEDNKVIDGVRRQHNRNHTTGRSRAPAEDRSGGGESGAESGASRGSSNAQASGSQATSEQSSNAQQYGKETGSRQQDDKPSKGGPSPSPSSSQQEQQKAAEPVKEPERPAAARGGGGREY